MKIFSLLFILAINSLTFSQVQFPFIANSNELAERVAIFGVNDVSNNFLEITNSSTLGNQFIPTIWAHQQADNRFVLRHFVTTNTINDTGTSPLMIFRTELRNQLNPAAPNGGTFPWGTVAANVAVRPLFAWENGNKQLMRIAANGNVTIGTALTPVNYKLAVGGKIIAEELKVQLQAQWPDYVFKKNYKLLTLAEVEKQIQDKGHLSNMPSAIEIEKNGFEVGETARVQQEKIEELTMYIIELNKKLDLQNDKIKSLILKK